DNILPNKSNGKIETQFTDVSICVSQNCLSLAFPWQRLDLSSGTAVQPTMTRRVSMEKFPISISSSSGHLADDLQCSSDVSGCVR
ncbi:hypothetical protein QQF64_032163, partial [Cirrhinus molitorella]